MTNDVKTIDSEEPEMLHHNKDITTIDGRTSIRSMGQSKSDKETKLNEAILIAGFPGPGLVGSISTNYIIEMLDMKQIACIESEFIIPGVIYTGGKLRHPFRLYANKQADICILVCEAPIMVQGIHPLLNTTMKWCVNNNIREVYALEGFPIQGMPPPNRQPVILSSDSKKQDEIQKIDLKFHDKEDKNNTYNNNNNKSLQKRPFSDNAYIGGITGGLLSACLSNEIPCTVLLIPTAMGIPDPEGAATLIETIGKVSKNEKLNTDTRQLREEGTDLRRRMEELIKSVRDQQPLQQVGGIGEQQPNQQVMYG